MAAPATNSPSHTLNILVSSQQEKALPEPWHARLASNSFATVLLTRLPTGPARSSSRLNSRALSSVLVSLHLAWQIDRHELNQYSSGMKVITHCPSLSQWKVLCIYLQNATIMRLCVYSFLSDVCPQADTYYSWSLATNENYEWQPMTAT